MKTYKDKLQGSIDGIVLREYFNYDNEQMIGLIMACKGIFYDEALARVTQAYKNIKKG